VSAHTYSATALDMGRTVVVWRVRPQPGGNHGKCAYRWSGRQRSQPTPVRRSCESTDQVIAHPPLAGLFCRREGQTAYGSARIRLKTRRWTAGFGFRDTHQTGEGGLSLQYYLGFRREVLISSAFFIRRTNYTLWTGHSTAKRVAVVVLLQAPCIRLLDSSFVLYQCYFKRDLTFFEMWDPIRRGPLMERAYPRGRSILESDLDERTVGFLLLQRKQGESVVILTREPSPHPRAW